VARDAQRTKALKYQGWNIHQIESKEWVSNPEFELAKLVAVLNKIRLDS
jgi:very-short-patch-repair endonuclease